MNAKTAAKIAALEATLKNDADVLSLAQKGALEATIQGLKNGATFENMKNAGQRAIEVGEKHGENVVVELGAAVVKLFEDTPAVLDAVKPNRAVIDVARAMNAVIDVTPVSASPMNVTREFVTAGEAIFTFKSVSGEHFTFRVERPEKFRGEYFGQVFKGTDNTDKRAYKYVGMVSGDALTLRATNGSRQFGADSKEFKVLALALDVIAGRKPLRDGYTLKHEGLCGKCAALLTNPESIERGIGPECLRNLRKAA